MSRQFSHLANEIAGKVHEAVCSGLARVSDQTMAIDRSMAIRMEESRQFLDRSAAAADQMFRAHHATLAEMAGQVARQVAAPVDALERIRLGMAELSSLQALLAQNLGALSQGNSSRRCCTSFPPPRTSWRRRRRACATRKAWKPVTAWPVPARTRARRGRLTDPVQDAAEGACAGHGRD